MVVDEVQGKDNIAKDYQKNLRVENQQCGKEYQGYAQYHKQHNYDYVLTPDHAMAKKLNYIKQQK